MAVLDRDFTVDEWGSFAQVVAGDGCPRCGASVELVRSVEAAHTFQLGHKYSEVMPGSSFVAEDGDEAIFSMGCYGMGVSRLLAVVAEEHHDDRGLAWPPEVAPFEVHLLALGAGRSPEVAEAADRLYERLVRGRGRGPLRRPGRVPRGQVRRRRPARHAGAAWWWGRRAWPGGSWSGGRGPPARSVSWRPTPRSGSWSGG